MVRVVWRARVVGTENVPLDGPLIVACNHVSYLDPPAMGCLCPRRISYMAKKELFEVPFSATAIRALGAYPVDRRGSATAAIKRSLEVLQVGRRGRNLPGGHAQSHAASRAADRRRAAGVARQRPGRPGVHPRHRPGAAAGSDRRRIWTAARAAGRPESNPRRFGEVHRRDHERDRSAGGEYRWKYVRRPFRGSASAWRSR